MLQILVLVLLPCPQLFEHSSQSPHSDQLPSTKKEKTPALFFFFSFFLFFFFKQYMLKITFHKSQDELHLVKKNPAVMKIHGDNCLLLGHSTYSKCINSLKKYLDTACCGSCVHLYQAPRTSSHHLLEEGCCTDESSPEHLDHMLHCKVAIQAIQKIHHALQWEK